MDEVRRRGSDERGFYVSDTGEARYEIARGWDEKRREREQFSYGKEGDR